RTRRWVGSSGCQRGELWAGAACGSTLIPIQSQWVNGRDGCPSYRTLRWLSNARELPAGVTRGSYPQAYRGTARLLDSRQILGTPGWWLSTATCFREAVWPVEQSVQTRRAYPMH